MSKSTKPASRPSSPRQPTTVIAQAVDTLRAGIMRGDLRPGQKLLEADLSRDLGISRASLREALRALEADRLIELVPNRGPFVSRLGPRDVEEIHDIWAILTGEAVFRFAELAKAKDLAALTAALRGLKVALREKDTLAQLAATNALFHVVVVGCGNRVLAGMIEGLVARVNFLRAQSLSLEGWASACAEEISEIVETIRAGRPPAARAATKRHITSACAAAKQVMILAGEAKPRRVGKVSQRAGARVEAE